jgi:hypothetical protein
MAVEKVKMRLRLRHQHQFRSSNPRLSDADTVLETLSAASIKLAPVLKAVKAAVANHIKLSINEYKNVGPEDVLDIDTGRQIVADYEMDADVFDLLRPKLPFNIDMFKIIIDFDAGRLGIRTVPSLMHEAACGAWDADINGWANNYGPVPPKSLPPFLPTRSAGIYRVSEFTNLLDYFYAARSKKSPDGSFRPRDIRIPPAIPIPGTIRPGRVGTAYPTLVFEFAYRHEGWQRLKDEARERAFSAMTSIRVFVGIKIYTASYQAFWARRSPTGVGMNIVESTVKLPVEDPTDIVFTIPAVEVFWGCGPNYQLPPLPSPNLVLSLEHFRLRIVEEM